MGLSGIRFLLLVHGWLAVSALLAPRALGQADPHATHAGHGTDTREALGLDPLRDAGVASVDREKALAGKGPSVADAAWKEIEYHVAKITQDRVGCIAKQERDERA